MRKQIKLIALVLAVCMTLSVLAGCGMFTKDMVKYRDQVVMTVGDEQVNLGQVSDAYTNLYIQYSSYIGSGVTVDSIFQMAMDSLYTQYMKVDAYKKSDGVVTYTQADNKYVGQFANAEYLSLAEMQFVVQYLKYQIFLALDSYTETYITSDYKLADVEEEDTSREFTEPDDMGSAKTYAEKLYNDNFVNEDMTKYFNDYYPSFDINSQTATGYSDYVYGTGDEGLTARVEEINKRIKDYIIDEEGEKDEYPTISAEEYIGWQNKAVKKYNDIVEDTYGINLETFYLNQTESFIVSILAAKYDYTVASKVEAEDTFVTDLQATYESALNSAKAGYNLNPDSFVTFIESLSSTGFIYYVPDKYNVNKEEGGLGNGYVFVKNLLVPFGEEQKAKLTQLKNIVGSTTDPAYIQYRNNLATEIVATDFLVEDEDNNKVENLFVMSGDQVIVNPDGALGENLNGGVVTAMQGKTQDETFVELMKRFNTDTAQHSATYDYVVRVGEVPYSYTSNWVTEFVDGANEAFKAGQYHYAIAVSDYGVHIVYYAKPVEAQTMNFAENMYDTTSAEYRYMKTFYTDRLTIFTTEATKELEETYKAGGLIKINKMFSTFLKDYGFTYDFDAAMEVETDDAE